MTSFFSLRFFNVCSIFMQARQVFCSCSGFGLLQIIVPFDKSTAAIFVPQRFPAPAKASIRKFGVVSYGLFSSIDSCFFCGRCLHSHTRHPHPAFRTCISCNAIEAIPIVPSNALKDGCGATDELNNKLQQSYSSNCSFFSNHSWRTTLRSSPQAPHSSS